MRILIFLLILFNSVSARCQDIDKKFLKSLVKTLASDSMDGRLTGTEGNDRAARFISKAFHEAGLNDVHLEEFTIIESGFSEAYLRSGNKKFYCPDHIMMQGAEHINTEVEKELVFAGNGTEDELKSVDVKGRVVLVFMSNMRNSYDVSRVLHKLGAFALIAANPNNSAQFESIRRGFKDHVMGKRLSLESRDSMRRKEPWDTLKSITTFHISNEVIPVLMKMSVRSLSKAIENKTLKEIPVTTIALKSEFKTRPLRTSNVIARLPGLVDSTIVVSAHFDHMGRSGNEIFHGADDNASGTASIIALAKEFSKIKSLRYSMTFVAFTGEEVGLLGSAYHTTSKDFDPKKVIFNLNLDMIGSHDWEHRPGETYIYVIGHSNPVPKIEVFEDAARESNITLDYSQSGTVGFFQRSDQYSFYKVGIPAIHLFSGVHERYHQSSDRWETIDYPVLEKRVEFAGRVLSRMEMK